MALSSEAIIALATLIIGLPSVFIGIYLFWINFRSPQNRRRTDLEEGSSSELSVLPTNEDFEPSASHRRVVGPPYHGVEANSTLHWTHNPSTNRASTFHMAQQSTSSSRLRERGHGH
ncbi:hypothetical protein TWF730_003166 [Orbilia blumenaviensis]|uniref:Uncharacterized protein n=1 Tax=Orbilia blumenaviensis TaxID=1796055 RepID=A0AAV9U7L2_9PEZI